MQISESSFSWDTAVLRHYVICGCVRATEAELSSGETHAEPGGQSGPLRIKSAEPCPVVGPHREQRLFQSTDQLPAGPEPGVVLPRGPQEI